MGTVRVMSKSGREQWGEVVAFNVMSILGNSSPGVLDPCSPISLSFYQLLGQYFEKSLPDVNMRLLDMFILTEYLPLTVAQSYF